MQSSDIPDKFAIPFANNAGAGFIRNIPQLPTGVTGQASLTEGFPPANFNPAGAGGVPPFGQDFNGLLKQMSSWNRWAATGSFPPYDPAWQAAVNGYPLGSIVQSLVEFGLLWVSIVEGNLTNPDTGGAGWFVWSRIVTANTDLYVNGATGNDNNNGKSAATALATLQGAINKAFSYPPSQFNITIHIADGTYAPCATPGYSGPTIIMDGNSGSPQNVIVSNPSGAAHCVLVTGPNVLTCKNLTVTNSGSLAAGGFVATGSGTMNTQNTRSGLISSGSVFEAYGGGIVNINGNHTFAGNAQEWFWSLFGGVMNIAPGITLTASGSLTTNITCLVQQLGILTMGPPNASFAGTPLASGQRFSVQTNGVVNVNGGGANVFPGASAGSTATGGQYN